MIGKQGRTRIISTTAFFLALFVTLHLYNSYREERLKKSLLEALDEGKMLADEYITGKRQKAAVPQAHTKPGR